MVMTNHLSMWMLSLLANRKHRFMLFIMMLLLCSGLFEGFENRGGLIILPKLALDGGQATVGVTERILLLMNDCASCISTRCGLRGLRL